ncbi:unnamed protein product, partial [marine sediment metagenome]
GDLRINAAINVTNAGVYEVTGYLKGNNKTISEKNNHTLSSGQQQILINFSGDDIRRNRITNATLYLINVKGSDYNFDFNYSIDYNLTDFEANDSMLADNYSDYVVDLNANNLSEYLIINVSVDIKTSGTYTLDLALYGLYDEFVKQINKTVSLGTGNQVVPVYVNGTDIYASHVNGPYVLSYVILKRNNDTLDTVTNAYITDGYYYDSFEQPLLPDLVISNLYVMNGSDFALVNVSVSNIGEGAAYGVELSYFDQEFE